MVDEATRRINHMAGVSKVVAGAYSETRHRQRPGEIKMIGRQTTSSGEVGSCTVRIYTTRGMQNMHVYTSQPDAFESQLKARVVKHAPVNGNATPAPEPARPAQRQAPNTTMGQALASAGLAAPPPVPSKPFEPQRIKRTKTGQPVYPATPAPMMPADPVMDTEVVGRLVEVTPDIACNWLERNTKNRRLRDTDVRKYAADMKAGRWKSGGNIIKFDVDGNIVNGQHVLWAVIESACTVPMYVLSGLDPSVVLVEDDHARRTLPDVIRIQHPGRAVGTKHAGIATILRVSMEWATGKSTHKWDEPRQEQIAFMERHWDAIQFASSVFGSIRKGIAISSVMAVIARAYYSQDHDLLRRFAQVLQTGLVQETTENAAVLLRNQLLDMVGSSSATMMVKQAIYYKTERALHAFIDREHLRVLKTQQDPQELFPLPEEPKRRRRTVRE